MKVNILCSRGEFGSVCGLLIPRGTHIPRCLEVTNTVHVYMGGLDQWMPLAMCIQTVWSMWCLQLNLGRAFCSGLPLEEPTLELKSRFNLPLGSNKYIPKGPYQKIRSGAWA